MRKRATSLIVLGLVLAAGVLVGLRRGAEPARAGLDESFEAALRKEMARAGVPADLPPRPPAEERARFAAELAESGERRGAPSLSSVDEELRRTRRLLDEIDAALAAAD